MFSPASRHEIGDPGTAGRNAPGPAAIGNRADSGTAGRASARRAARQVRGRGGGARGRPGGAGACRDRADWGPQRDGLGAARPMGRERYGLGAGAPGGGRLGGPSGRQGLLFRPPRLGQRKCGQQQCCSRGEYKKALHSVLQAAVCKCTVRKIRDRIFCPAAKTVNREGACEAV